MEYAWVHEEELLVQSLFWFGSLLVVRCRRGAANWIKRGSTGVGKALWSQGGVAPVCPFRNRAPSVSGRDEEPTSTWGRATSVVFPGVPLAPLRTSVSEHAIAMSIISFTLSRSLSSCVDPAHTDPASIPMPIVAVLAPGMQVRAGSPRRGMCVGGFLLKGEESSKTGSGDEKIDAFQQRWSGSSLVPKSVLWDVLPPAEKCPLSRKLLPQRLDKCKWNCSLILR